MTHTAPFDETNNNFSKSFEEEGKKEKKKDVHRLEGSTFMRSNQPYHARNPMTVNLKCPFSAASCTYGVLNEKQTMYIYIYIHI